MTRTSGVNDPSSGSTFPPPTIVTGGPRVIRSPFLCTTGELKVANTTTIPSWCFSGNLSTAMKPITLAPLCIVGLTSVFLI